MDLSKLSTSDKVVAGSGLALFIFSFFPWFGVEGFDGGRTSGGDYFLFDLPMLLGSPCPPRSSPPSCSTSRSRTCRCRWGQAYVALGGLAAAPRRPQAPHR